MNTINKEFIKHALSIFNPLSTFESFVKNKTFIHPITRNKVLFESLPKNNQHFIKQQWLSQQHIRDKNLFKSIERDLHNKQIKQEQEQLA